MNAENFYEDALTELRAIRKLLETKPASALPRASSGSTGAQSGDQVPIPQPTELVSDPGAEVVFFGKNNGKRLDELGERSAEWYAQESAPRLNNQGQPFPERPQERALKNAARQLFHQRKGTLIDSRRNTPPDRPANSAGASVNLDEENVPFAPRHLEHG